MPEKVSEAEIRTDSWPSSAATAIAMRGGPWAPGGVFHPSHPRYELTEVIASGSEGVVYLAVDGDLGREVAMKVLRPEHAAVPVRAQRFLDEARRTSRLEHAAIPAVYEVGHTMTGEPFFTMRLARGRTLEDVLAALRAGSTKARGTWTLVRLVQVVQRIAEAVSHAHDHGLLHRDLKPANVAVGEHGDVLVLDWGLSRPIVPDGDYSGPAVAGTPIYMSPEQARGDTLRLGPRTDVFALGAVLYEVLCLRALYDAEPAGGVMAAARLGKIVPPSERARGRDIPRVLEEAAMRALSPDPGDRFESPEAFAEELFAFLDGTKERELRERESKSLLEVATRLAAKCGELEAEAGRLRGRAAVARDAVPMWAPAESKATLWSLEDATERMRVDADHTYARAVDLTSRSLAHDPLNPAARELMARLYYDRYSRAQRLGNDSAAAWLRRMVELYNDGSLDELMRDSGCLLVTVEPPDARVTIARCTERARRLVPETTGHEVLGSAALESLTEGRYLVTARRPGRATARIAVVVNRGGVRTLDLRLPAIEQVPSGFVFVPGGPFLGGAEGARVECDAPDFAIGVLPVLLTEYAEWLDDVHRLDPDAVEPHIPWTESHGPLLHHDGGRYVFCPAGPFSPQPLAPAPRLPVVGVTRKSASAYSAWLGGRMIAAVDLPSEVEWEKAARGTDGRVHPWGDRFDATFCSMVSSTAETSTLREAGSFPPDVSPYGVRDMAGGVREWCRDDVDAGRRQAVCRGGAWYLHPEDCTAASRWLVDRSTRNPGIGFRVVIRLGLDVGAPPELGPGQRLELPGSG